MTRARQLTKPRHGEAGSPAHICTGGRGGRTQIRTPCSQSRRRRGFGPRPLSSADRPEWHGPVSGAGGPGGRLARGLSSGVWPRLGPRGQDGVWVLGSKGQARTSPGVRVAGSVCLDLGLGPCRPASFSFPRLPPQTGFVQRRPWRKHTGRSPGPQQRGFLVWSGLLSL